MCGNAPLYVSRDAETFLGEYFAVNKLFATPPVCEMKDNEFEDADFGKRLFVAMFCVYFQTPCIIAIQTVYTIRLFCKV